MVFGWVSIFKADNNGGSLLKHSGKAEMTFPKAGEKTLIL